MRLFERYALSPCVEVRFGDGSCFWRCAVAATHAERRQGLEGVEGLDDDEGLLFPLEQVSAVPAAEFGSNPNPLGHREPGVRVKTASAVAAAVHRAVGLGLLPRAFPRPLFLGAGSTPSSAPRGARAQRLARQTRGASARATTFHMGAVSFPIDLVFVNNSRRVGRVVHNAQPGAREQWSHPDVLAVVELQGGRARASGIVVGVPFEVKLS